MSVPGRRGRPRGFDRAQVLDRAVQAFWASGYEATSLRELGKAMGLSAPSLYNAFGDKGALFAEAFAAYENEYGGSVERAVREAPSAIAALHRVIGDAPGMHTRSGLPRGCLVANGDLGATEPKVRELFARSHARNRALLLERLLSDPATHEWDESTCTALVDYVLAVRAGLAQSARRGATRKDLEAAAEVAARAIPTVAEPEQ